MERTILSLLAAVLGAFGAALAGDGAGVDVGQVAPSFSLPGSDGKTYTLEGLRGKTVVLAWFPKAFTGG